MGDLCELIKNNSKVIFREIFNTLNNYFNYKNEVEIYFYRYIWNILDDYGLINYKNYYEKTIILIRACVIINLYSDFCSKYFGTPLNRNYIIDFSKYYGDEIVDCNFILGQLLGDEHFNALNCSSLSEFLTTG